MNALGGVWGDCVLAAFTDHPEHVPHSLAIASDHEGYAAELNTHADFGCVQFVSKAN